MCRETQDDDKELLTALVSCVNAPWITPHNRGKRDVLISFHNGQFLLGEDADTVGFAQIHSSRQEMINLLFVPQRFVGKEVTLEDHYLRRFICPASGNTVQQELMQVVARSHRRGVKSGGAAPGCLAGFFVARLISESLHVIRKARSPGYFDVLTGNIWFDAPIKRHHLQIRTYGDLRRAGLLKSLFQHATEPQHPAIPKQGVFRETLQ